MRNEVRLLLSPSVAVVAVRFACPVAARVLFIYLFIYVFICLFSFLTLAAQVAFLPWRIEAEVMT